MEIQAGGRRWLVEAHEEEEQGAAALGYWEVSFTLQEKEDDRVEMRWIPRPERLTESVAKRLFELAGERLWSDRRTGAIYRIHLVDEGRPGDDSELSDGRILIQFRTATSSGTIPYGLDRALGLATDRELEHLADLVQPHMEGVLA